MAFRSPQAAPPRHVSQPQRIQVSRPSSLHRPLDQSQEWVLFSPSTYSHTLSPTEATPRTAAASRLSDFGSLNSILPPSEEGVERDHGDVDDLDSLDDGLHEFREPSHIPASGRHEHNEGTILPQHDGLGSFQASSHAVQEHLWQHERFNPRRRSTVHHHHHRTTSSIHRRLEAMDNELEKEHPFMEGEKLDRIERWRLDQSRVMLEEVHKEARRRRRLSLGGHSQAQSIPAAINTKDIPTPSISSAKADTFKSPESETFWQRITRRVIKDFMGIDDSVLSVILGESLPSDDLLSTTPKAINSQTISEKLKDVEEEHLAAGWEDRLLKRLARELNTIVYNLSDHPGAASTQGVPETFDYAGIPIKARAHPPIPETEELELGQTPKANPDSLALFGPTLQKAQESLEASEHEAGWGIEESSPTDDNFGPQNLAYWERTPDLRQVFAYLSRRFLMRNDGSLPPPASLAEMASSASTKLMAATTSTTTTTKTTATASTRARSTIATHATPDSIRRAAIIREHHPLVSRAHEARLAKQRRSQHQRRPSLKSIAELVGAIGTERPSHGVAASEGGAPLAAAEVRSLKRIGDDCASQSTKRSKTSRSRKHYWDMGSGSAAAALGGMGAWGEV